MRGISAILGAVAVLAGFWLMYMAYNTTTILNLPIGTPSAVQVTQVYSQASFYGIMAIACFAFATVMVVLMFEEYVAQRDAVAKYEAKASYSPPIRTEYKKPKEQAVEE